MKIVYAGISDAGLKRSINQDSIFMFSNREREISIFAVADGMGGHAQGEMASKAIADGLKDWAENLHPNFYENNFMKIMGVLEDRLKEISREIYLKYNQNKICGSTCLVLLIYKDRFGVINVGDSRIFYKKGYKVDSFMVDDVWENQRIVRDTMSKREIRKHSNYGKLLQAMGASKNVSLAVKTDMLKAGEAFLLCSDGLYKYCSSRYYERILRNVSEKNMQASVSALIEKAYKMGAGDNISVILVKCV